MPLPLAMNHAVSQAFWHDEATNNKGSKDQTSFMDHSLVVAKGLCNNEAMSHAVQSQPRQIGPGKEFWQNMVFWRRKWQNTPVFLPREPHEQYEKTKSYGTRRWAPRSEGVWYATGKEQRAITNSSRKKSGWTKVAMTLSCGYVWWWK